MIGGVSSQLSSPCAWKEASFHRSGRWFSSKQHSLLFPFICIALYSRVGMCLCNSSVEAFGRSAQRPRLHKQDAVVSAGAEGAAGWTAEESLHLRCLLWRLHQTNINFCRCQFPQTTQAWHWPHTQTYNHLHRLIKLRLPRTCTDLLSWTIPHICPNLNQRVLPTSLFATVGLPWEQTVLNAGRHAILSYYFEK